MRSSRIRAGESQVCVQAERQLEPYLGLQRLLDVIADEIRSDRDTAGAIQVLTDGLREIKERVSNADWLSSMIPAARAHPVSRFIYQCPLTEHACTRPRGYPGDAELLDLIYGHAAAQSKVERATATGRAIYDVTVAVSACESVRQRRRVIAAKIDEVCERRPDARVLSVACGHLREAEISHALRNDRVGRLIAIDQDPLSLNVVEEYTSRSESRIEARRIAVRDLILGRHDLGRFDFVYAVGLYDYLQGSTAARLTRKLFSLLDSGGSLLVTNFLHGIWEAPYMEAYMDWHLIYRDEQEIRRFLSEVPADQLESQIYWPDAAGCIGYVEAVRR